ncbi:MAG: flagellin, partial [Pseudomonadota bacterium]|nr:flagellin [Pseudomonadota bacterium]
LPALLSGLDTSIKNVSSALIRLGAASNAFQGQQNFLRKLQDAATAGVGQLVDAELAKEGARLRALQTKQQLGVQALSIANRAPQILTKLFRS